MANHAPYLHLSPARKKAVLMIHGICSTPRHFDFLVSSLPKDVTVYTLLLPGHGGTVKDFGGTSMKAWREETEKALCFLEQEHEELYVVGYSMGTLLALEALPRHPKVKGLLLLNPPFRPWVRWEMAKRSRRFTKGRVNEADPHEAACLNSIGIRLAPKAVSYLRWIPRFLELLILCRKARRSKQKLTVPCKGFLGKRDELVSIRSEKYLKRLPAEVRISQEAGHFYYPEKDRAWMCEALRELLES